MPNGTAPLKVVGCVVADGDLHDVVKDGVTVHTAALANDRSR